MRKIILLTAILAVKSLLHSQALPNVLSTYELFSGTPSNPLPEYNNGLLPETSKIHVVILADGYDNENPDDVNSDANLFYLDALKIVDAFGRVSPFQEYFNYFKFYFVRTNSSHGIYHPGESVFFAEDCQSSEVDDPICESISIIPVSNILEIPPAFGSSFDNFGVHRGLKSNVDLVEDFIENYFGTGFPNVFTIVLANSSEYGGTANISKRICHIVGRMTTSSPAQVGLDEQGALHEFAHIFGPLQDNYFFALPNCSGLDINTFNNASNRFFNPSISTPISSDVPWHHWLESGVPIQPVAQIGIYSYTTTPSCVGVSGDAPPTSMVRPVINSKCKMYYPTYEFCAVCRETIVESIHNLVSPINSYTPSNNNSQIFPISSSQNFEINLNIPVRVTFENDFASMVVSWSILDETGTNTLESMQQVAPTTTPVVPSAALYQFVDETHAGICDWFDGKEAGNYQIKVEVYDRAGLSEDLADNSRWVRHPNHINHKHSVIWTVHYSGIPGTDLYAMDQSDDIGDEPYLGSSILWESPDIWVCNNNMSDCTQDEPLEYISNPTNVQVNVWVQNRGCKVYDHTADNGIVTFHWANAGTELVWPSSWDGTSFFELGLVKGDEIEQVDITENIDIAHERVRVSANWSLPDPSDYEDFFEGVDFTHFCLLARINSDNDLLNEVTVEPYPLYTNVKHNNNIVWKNFTIIDKFDGITGQTFTDDVVLGGSVIVGNNSTANANFKLQFQVPTNETGKPITEEAEVRLTLSDSLWQRWVNGGKQGYEIEEFNASRQQILLTADSAYISNIALDSSMHTGLYVSVNFLTNERSAKELFTLRALQILDDSTQRVLGGETYIIKPDPYRAHFDADAGDDQDVLIGNAYSQNAKTIADSAIYNWYNSSGVKVFSGATMTDSATSTSTETYKLEVIAKEDGYKDYDEVTITTTLGRITSVAPNPINTGTLAIGYKVSSTATSPKIRIVNISTSAFTEHTISTGTGTLNIDISAYASGAHTILLICNSTTVDDELLVVQ